MGCRVDTHPWLEEADETLCATVCLCTPHVQATLGSSSWTTRQQGWSRLSFLGVNGSHESCRTIRNICRQTQRMHDTHTVRRRPTKPTPRRGSRPLGNGSIRNVARAACVSHLRIKEKEYHGVLATEFYSPCLSRVITAVAHQRRAEHTVFCCLQWSPLVPRGSAEVSRRVLL